MPKQRKRLHETGTLTTVTAMVLCALMPTAHFASAGDVPLGHRDFFPSDERPVGFCGDGNAYFPGATPVREFWDGTPVKIRRESREPGWKKQVVCDHWDFKDDKPKNIIWKTMIPGWANTQPTVVGERVFTYTEPYSLVCCDGADGRILWTVEANPWRCAGVAPAMRWRVNAV